MASLSLGDFNAIFGSNVSLQPKTDPTDPDNKEKNNVLTYIE